MNFDFILQNRFGSATVGMVFMSGLTVPLNALTSMNVLQVDSSLELSS